MAAPRFIPKEHSTTPAAFGKQSSIVWKSPDELKNPAELFAAQWQHAYAIAMRDEIAVQFDGALSTYARKAGCKYDRLTKILRGDQIMQSIDVGVASQLLPGLHERALGYLGVLVQPETPTTSKRQSPTQ